MTQNTIPRPLIHPVQTRFLLRFFRPPATLVVYDFFLSCSDHFVWIAFDSFYRSILISKHNTMSA